MTDIALRLKDEILRLSDEDRLELARILWDSVDGDTEATADLDAAWIDELELRSAEANAGRATEQPFRDVIAELRGEAP
jgi:putative addiction module component (TIGR02574 family)